MTVIQFLGLWLVLCLFVPLGITVIGVLAYIDDGEYRKALYTSVVSVALTIIIFALILSVF